MQQEHAARPSQPEMHSVYTCFACSGVFGGGVLTSQVTLNVRMCVCVLGRLQESTGLADWGTSYGSLVDIIWVPGDITWAHGYVIQVSGLLGGGCSCHGIHGMLPWQEEAGAWSGLRAVHDMHAHVHVHVHGSHGERARCSATWYDAAFCVNNSKRCILVGGFLAVFGSEVHGCAKPSTVHVVQVPAVGA
jgi:hypothetical protein